MEKGFDNGRGIIDTLRPLIRPGATMAVLAEHTGAGDYRSLAGMAKDLYAGWIMEAAGAIGEDTRTAEMFPSTETSTGGHTLMVHGTVHTPGLWRWNTPYSHMVKWHIIKSLSEGDDWYAEERLKKAFGLPEAVVELSDHTAFIGREETSTAGLGGAESYSGPFMDEIRRLRLENRLIATQTSFIWDRFAESEDGRKILRQILDKPRLIVPMREWIAKASLPEPLNMEASLLMAFDSLDELRSRRHLVVHKSMLQAHELRRIIKGKPGGGQARVLTGLAHESQLAYFFSNPAYDPVESLTQALGG